MIVKLAQILPRPLRALAARFDRGPLAEVEALGEFVRTRASYVAQTSMYGYLKTRMGTQFPSFFEDETFSRSIRIASAGLYTSCLGDLSVFAAATANSAADFTAADAAGLAGHCFDLGLVRTLAGDDAALIPPGADSRFRARLQTVDWRDAAVAANAFAGSEADIVRFAPVVDEYKQLDREIVSNSIRFRWRDVREQLRKRIEPDSLCADWQRITGTAAP